MPWLDVVNLLKSRVSTAGTLKCWKSRTAPGRALTGESLPRDEGRGQRAIGPGPPQSDSVRPRSQAMPNKLPPTGVNRSALEAIRRAQRGA